jgi:hypothetical protein
MSINVTLKGLAAALVCLLVSAFAPATARADSDEDLKEILAGGAWHVKSVPCMDGKVTSVVPRLGRDGQTAFSAQDFEQTGVRVDISFPDNAKLYSFIPGPGAAVVHYQGTPGNAIMQAERAGDRVQVCLLSFPVPRRDPSTGRVLCDPDQDPRGFEFRVYDYRQHRAYAGPDSQHSCGGA